VDSLQHALSAVDLLQAHMDGCIICRVSHTFCIEGGKLRSAIDAAAVKRPLFAIGDDSRSTTSAEGRPMGSE